MLIYRWIVSRRLLATLDARQSFSGITPLQVFLYDLCEFVAVGCGADDNILLGQELLEVSIVINRSSLSALLFLAACEIGIDPILRSLKAPPTTDFRVGVHLLSFRVEPRLGSQHFET